MTSVSRFSGLLTLVLAACPTGSLPAPADSGISDAEIERDTAVALLAELLAQSPVAEVTIEEGVPCLISAPAPDGCEWLETCLFTGDVTDPGNSEFALGDTVDFLALCRNNADHCDAFPLAFLLGGLAPGDDVQLACDSPPLIASTPLMSYSRLAAAYDRTAALDVVRATPRQQASFPHSLADGDLVTCEGQPSVECD